MDQKLEKWERWLVAIYDEIVHLADSRQVYTETSKVILSNDALPKDNDFFVFLQEWYVHSIVMDLRRQLKTDSDSISLAGFLKDIAGASHLLSRDRFVNMVNKDGREEQLCNEAFDKYAGEGEDYISSQRVEEDLRKFQDLSDKCEAYADRLIAHHDKRGLSVVPSYQELNDALDFMNELLQKYFCLIRGNTLQSVTPVILNNWKTIFNVPWLP